MDIKTASIQTGLSETTLRRMIKAGTLKAALVGSGPTRHWEIEPEALGSLGKSMDNRMDNQTSNMVILDATVELLKKENEWLKGELEARREEIREKDAQLRNKDTQIHELHILLQQAQEQVQRMLPAPRRRRWWWPFS